MPQITIYLESKHHAPLATIELEDGFVPRVGEIIHSTENADRGMEWYLVKDVRYTINNGSMNAEVTANAVSSDPYKGIDAMRFEMLNRDGWLDFEFEDPTDSVS